MICTGMFGSGFRIGIVVAIIIARLGWIPWGPDIGSSRVVRGGYFGNDAQDLRSAYRLGLLPGNRSYWIGVRLVKLR